MRPRITCFSSAAAAALFLAAAPNWVPAATPAPPCSASARPVFQDIPVALEGRARLKRTIDLPAGTGVLLTASESGVDIRIEVQAGSSAPAIASDNPLRRWGPQRVVLPAGPARTVSIQVIGKEGVRGRVRLSGVALPTADDVEPCAAALRALAEGDASFARAQLISLGLSEAPAGSASREYEAAVRNYQRAAAAVAALGPNTLLAQAQLSAAAVLYQGLQNWAEALRMGQLAHESFRAVRDKYGEDRARAFAASAEIEVALGALDAAPSDAAAEQRMTSMLAHARQAFIDVAAHHASRGELYDQAVALNNLGLAFYYQDTYDPAIRAYQRAYALYESLGERRRQAQTLQNIAVVQQELARYSAARESYARVLRLIDESADAALFADVLNNLAVTEAEIGEADAALRHFSQALGVLTRIQSVREQARSLQGIGLVYFGLGNRREALDYFNRALALRTAALDPLGRVDSLRWAANGLADLRRWPEAIALREEALRLAQSGILRARILVELARDEGANGSTDKALARVQEAIAADAGGDRVAYARALLERSRLRLTQRSYDQAKRDADGALSIFRSYELPTSTFEAIVLQARIACAGRDGTAARAFIDEALTLAEPVRRTSANPMLRTSLWQSLRPAFDFSITLLADPQTCGGEQPATRSAGTEFDALEIAERSRNRALSDYLQLAQRRGSATGRETGAEARRRALFEDIAARRMQMEVLLQRVSPQDPRVRALQIEVAALKRNIDILGSEIAAPLKSAVGRDDGAARLRARIETIQKGTAVVEYWLGNENTYAWLITKDRVRMVDLGSTSRITAAAHRLHESLSSLAAPAEDRVRRARELHDLIFAPLPEEVRRAGTLLFVPDGALHYVAFGVLAAPGTGTDVRYLIDDHDIAVAPSLLFDSNTEIRAQGGTASVMLLVSDPVYSRSDARFNSGQAAGRGTLAAESTTRSSSSREWQRLTGSQREAANIARLLPAGSLDTLSGFDATREALLQRDLSRYRILHFATHGTADAEAPQLSTLVLSTYDRNGRSIAGEVFAGDLLHRPLNADLVVLSACDTSIGQETAGEGLLGLRYAAHASGARSVVASLWPVADVIGARIMADFYSRVVRDHLSPTQALSQVMRSARRQWFDPALWGVFEVSHSARETVVQ
jgi:CHAT domain-containing protein/tetratricopeptide (TPR) repeat protein